jgi:hypothetical protein
MAIEITEQGASQLPSFLFKVYSPSKRTEILDILRAPNPTHYERLWLVGFLKYIGYSYEEVLQIIELLCEWSDYNPEITAYQVRSVFKIQRNPNGNGRKNNGNGKRRPRKWDLTPYEVYRNQYARSQENTRKLESWLREHGLPVYEHPFANNDGDFTEKKPAHAPEMLDTHCARCGKAITIWKKEPNLCHFCASVLEIFTPVSKFSKFAKRTKKTCGYWEGLLRFGLQFGRGAERNAN